MRKRRNPSPATTLAALRYRRDKSTIRALRESAPDDQTVDEALEMIEGLAGTRTERESSLHILSEYILSTYDNGIQALRWLTHQDQRLGVWCAAQIIREYESFLPKDKIFTNALSAAEGWVRGSVTTRQVLDASEDADVTLSGVPRKSFFLAQSAYFVSQAAGAENGKASSFQTTAAANRVALALATAEERPDIERSFVPIIANAILSYPIVRR